MPADEPHPWPIDVAVWRDLQDTAGADFAADLAQTFIDEAPAMLAQMRDSHAQRDAETLRRTAHALKANALTFGAAPLAALARTLELNGIVGDDTAPLVALEATFRHSAAALRELARG